MPRRRPKPPKPEPKRHERAHGHGSIVALAENSFRAFRPADKAGKRISKRFGTRTEAERWLDGAPLPATLLVGPYLERWLTLRSPTLRGRTTDTYRQFLSYAGPLAGLALAALSTDDCQLWLNGLLSTHTRYSVKVTRGILSTALGSAVPKLIPANPLRGTRLPAPEERPVRAWRRDEVTRLLSAAQGSPHAIWLAVAIGTGLRLGELRALEWADVDLAARTVRVSKSLDDRTNRLGPTKTGRIRVVDLPDELAPELVAHRARQPAAERLVFGHGGKPYHPSNYRKWLRRLCARAGVTVLSCHSSRHSFAAIALDANVPIQDVAHALGHSSIAITASTYSHFIGDRQRRVAIAIGAVLRVGPVADDLAEQRSAPG